ncbi:uncharacterized protein LOC133058763 [Dama dama]|uniref:uncharacterized protein LOC133058763 n=1 Tax=Dama dama TaxID=30532 RepID=UPI002A36A972|nr:uncharacterized protein LOC133058763 [Dama dama]XP_061001693.1 uncharacterized protein LOC133058763 [Dama dama]
MSHCGKVRSAVFVHLVETQQWEDRGSCSFFTMQLRILVRAGSPTQKETSKGMDQSCECGYLLSFGYKCSLNPNPRRPVQKRKDQRKEQEVLVRDVERTSYHQPEEFRKDQKESGNTSLHMLPTSQNPPRWNPSWLSDACAARKDPDGPARSNSETSPITIKPETANHVAEWFSWVPLPSCSPPSCPSQ